MAPIPKLEKPSIGLAMKIKWLVLDTSTHDHLGSIEDTWRNPAQWREMNAREVMGKQKPVPEQ